MRPALTSSHFVAPTSTPERMKKIARASRRFIYLVSLTGVTGERSELPPDLTQHLRALRTMTTKPICVGFGIATPEHAAAVGRLADGVIVGSAIVRLVERHAGSPALVPSSRRLHRRAEGAAKAGSRRRSSGRAGGTAAGDRGSGR